MTTVFWAMKRVGRHGVRYRRAVGRVLTRVLTSPSFAGFYPGGFELARGEVDDLLRVDIPASSDISATMSGGSVAPAAGVRRSLPW